ncbi:MAG: tetratricopeptide repeat protein [Candidatus Omnitrophica bacterium]|nr:tetratricopeptide repeat protein [Candidatus Omnitrophota bacterium]
MQKMLIKKWIILIIGLFLLSFNVLVIATEDFWQLKQQKLAEAQQHYEKGKIYIQEGNYTAANLEFNRVEILLQEIQGLSALMPAELPIKSETTQKDFSHKATEEEKKRMDKALTYYLTELKKETSNPDYYYNLGIEYLLQGQFIQAEEAFKLVLNLNPLDKDACYNLAVLYENYLGNKDKAIKYYQQYLNISGDAPDANLVKSWIIQLQEGQKK